MYKCPKCEYTNEMPGTCPTDNETLVEVQGETPNTQETTETAPTEPTPETTPPEEKAS